MARNKKHGAHENHERWLVSYADFITLLFAFFVVMFASSQGDRGKAAQVSESVRRALEEGQIASVLAGILGGTTDNKGIGNAMMKGPGGAKKSAHEERAAPQPGVLAELLPSLRFLSTELKREIEDGQLQIELKPRGLVVSLRQAAFFPSGEDTLDPKTYPALEKIANTILKLPNPVRLEGHTDAVPIHNSRFKSNWELSAARSIAMLDLLTTRFQVPRERLAVAGYAETIPVASNDEDEGRARNRRVDIVILNQQGLSTEPVTESKPEPPRKPSPAH